MNQTLQGIILGTAIFSGCSDTKYSSKPVVEQSRYESSTESKPINIKAVYKYPDGHLEWYPKEATEEQARDFYSNQTKRSNWKPAILETRPTKTK